MQRELDQDVIFDQVVGDAGVDDAEVFAVDGKLGVNGKRVGGDGNRGRKGDSTSHTVELEIAGHRVRRSVRSARFDRSRGEARLGKFLSIEQIGGQQMVGELGWLHRPRRNVDFGADGARGRIRIDESDRASESGERALVLRAELRADEAELRALVAEGVGDGARARDARGGRAADGCLRLALRWVGVASGRKSREGEYKSEQWARVGEGFHRQQH